MLNLLMPRSFDLQELSDRTKVSTRTIRFYIQQGLLPSPDARGPGAHYGQDHVDRLLLIKRLQQEHLPLSEIRRRIERLSPDEIGRALAAKPEKTAGSALAYVQRVLSEGVGSVKVADSEAAYVRSPAVRYAEPRPSQATRSQWERFTFAPDVELHVRRPVSREDNRKIERLLEAAREIFNEDSP